MLRKLFSTIESIPTVSLSVFSVVTFIGGSLAYLFGPWNVTFKIMLIIIATDMITGIIIAIKGKSPKSENGKLSSKAGEKGVFKKLGLIASVGFANVLGMLFPDEARLALREGVILAIIWNEAVSVLENFDILEWWVPEVLKQFIQTNKKKSDKENQILNNQLTEEPVSDEENNNESEEVDS